MLEFTLDNNDSPYQIRAYQVGQLQVNQEILMHSAIVTPQQLIHPWSPQHFNELTAAHLALLLPLNAELILLGTGAQSHHCPPAWLMPFYAQKIGLDCMTSNAACRTFNILAAEGRRVVAAILIN